MIREYKTQEEMDADFEKLMELKLELTHKIEEYNSIVEDESYYREHLISLEEDKEYVKEQIDTLKEEISEYE